MEKEHASGASGAQYLTFDIAGEEYAIPIVGISEIVDCSRMAELPGVVFHMRGVLCRGSEVVPVVDLALVQGLPATPLSRWTCIVIVDVEDGSRQSAVGVLVNIQTCRITSAQGIAELVVREPSPLRSPSPAPAEWPNTLLWGKPVRGLG